MKASDLDHFLTSRSMSRAEWCRRIGISLNSGTKYVQVDEFPLTVSLATKAIQMGLTPYSKETDPTGKISDAPKQAA